MLVRHLCQRWLAEIPKHMHHSLQYGNGTLRLTTRQCYQLHGVLKGDLKSVFSSVIKNMGSTLVSSRFSKEVKGKLISTHRLC